MIPIIGPALRVPYQNGFYQPPANTDSVTNNNISAGVDEALDNGLKTAFDSNILNYDSAEKVMKYNAQQAALNREWQKMMSDTQYQRLVQDLKKAGINPLMAVQGMNGISYSGTSASTSNQTYDNDQTIISALIRGASQIISSALKGVLTAALKGFI